MVQCIMNYLLHLLPDDMADINDLYTLILSELYDHVEQDCAQKKKSVI